MRKLLIAVVFVLVAGMTYAQSSPKEDVALIQAYFGKQKQELVSAYMNLNDDAGTKFWPLYEAYEQERQALVRERGENIVEYASKYGELNDESANKIMNSILGNDVKIVNLEKKYLGKMSKAVGGITAVKFFQLENYLRNLISSQIEEQIPAIDDLK